MQRCVCIQSLNTSRKLCYRRAWGSGSDGPSLCM